jgi:S1-C subfamily serine protease
VPPPAEPDWGEIAQSVVLVWASGCESAGSGTVVLDGQHVLTNAHVVRTDTGRVCTGLSIGLSDGIEEEPNEWIAATVVAFEGGMTDSSGNATLPDLAVLVLSRATGRRAIPVAEQQLDLNEEIVVLGFPGIGGQTITLVRGVLAGVGESEGHEVLKTDADISPGNSGGAAFDMDGVLVGVPTFSSVAEDRAADLGWLIPAAEAAGFLARHVGG